MENRLFEFYNDIELKLFLIDELVELESFRQLDFEIENLLDFVSSNIKQILLSDIDRKQVKYLVNQLNKDLDFYVDENEEFLNENSLQESNFLMIFENNKETIYNDLENDFSFLPHQSLQTYIIFSFLKESNFYKSLDNFFSQNEINEFLQVSFIRKINTFLELISSTIYDEVFQVLEENNSEKLENVKFEIQIKEFRKDVFRNSDINDLFNYLIENYYNLNKGKYSQIFRYIDSLNGFICSQSYYIKFIKETYDVSISKILDENYNDNLLLKERHQEFDKLN
ncbi:hypothetical protein OBJ95_12750 [Empedobacter falsenii]